MCASTPLSFLSLRGGGGSEGGEEFESMLVRQSTPFQVSFYTGNIPPVQTLKAEVFVRGYYQFLWDLPPPPPKPSTTVDFHKKMKRIQFCIFKTFTS